MSTNISAKDFMDQVEMRLKAYSPGALREILMEWARETHPSKRSEFLSRLVPPTTARETTGPDEGLLDDIGDLAKRVESGEYCEGWGWDDEIRDERDWGDESWKDEVDEFFARAHDAMTAGHYELARDAYARLFDILEMGEEPGHLPGSPDPQDMLCTDLEEARSCYLRSVYLSSAPDERPTELWGAMQRFGYHLGDDVNLRGIAGAERNPLPDFARFLPTWIQVLKRTDGRSARSLLREAVILSGGTSAIAKLAREEGDRHPEAYVDWIKALEKSGEYDSMLQAAKEGIASVPRDLVVRAEIAEGMTRAGEHLHDTDIQLLGWREAFHSNPSLSRLLSLLSVAEQKGCHGEEIGAAIARIASLVETEGKRQGRSFPVDAGLRESVASGSLLSEAYLLAGRYQDALDLCKGEGALGWTGMRNPKGLVIPFFLVLLSRSRNPHSRENLERLWKEAVHNISGYGHNEQDVVEGFQQAMDGVFRSVNLSEDEENKYVRWVTEETSRRVDAIVGEKHRQSYHKAATLLVALAEMMTSRNMKSNSTAVVARYREKYRRHFAFRQELDAATRRSSVFM